MKGWCFSKGGYTPVYKASGGAWTRSEGKSPEGGLNEKGRASFALRATTSSAPSLRLRQRRARRLLAVGLHSALG